MKVTQRREEGGGEQQGGWGGGKRLKVGRLKVARKRLKVARA